MRFSSYQELRIPNFSVHTLSRVLEDNGFDWRAALSRAQIDPAVAQRHGGTVPAKKELAFQLEFVALTKNRTELWVEAARSYTLGSFGVRGLAFVAAPTIEAWIQAGATDDAPSLLETAPLRTRDGQLIGLEVTYPDAPEELVPFSVYRELVVISRIFSWLYGGPFPFTRIDVPLPEISPEVSAMIPGLIYCGVGQALRFWWEPAASTYRLPFGDEFQYATWVAEDTRVLNTLRRTSDWPSTVEQVIRAAPHLNRKLANAAVALRVSPRTLQRKLELTGHDFARLRDATLSALASELLVHTNNSVAHISRLLGYADPASFTSAFKRWMGMPPTAYRDASEYSDSGQGDRLLTNAERR